MSQHVIALSRVWPVNKMSHSDSKFKYHRAMVNWFQGLKCCLQHIKADTTSEHQHEPFPNHIRSRPIMCLDRGRTKNKDNFLK